MPIQRTDLGDYEKVKKAKRCERKPNDFDLGWKDQRLYVLDEHEWFDPHTSTKYHDGISRHAMYGPAVICQSRAGGSLNTEEYHVNDPFVWAWVRRVIEEGYLTGENMTWGTINHEKYITEMYEKKKSDTKVTPK